MAHPIPKELKGDERIFTIPLINAHFNKKGVVYNGAVTILSVIIGKFTNLWVFLVLFLLLNIVAYPLAHMKTPKGKFEGGNIPLDKYFIRKYKFRKLHQNIYVRKLRK